MNDEELIRRLEENKAALEEVRTLTERTVHYVKWIRIFDIIKILIIVIPLVAAYLYLPSLLQNMLGSYGDILPMGLIK